MLPPPPMPPPVWGAPDGIGVAEADVTTAGGVWLAVTVTTTVGVVVVVVGDGDGDGTSDGVTWGLGITAGGVVAVLVQGGVGFEHGQGLLGVGVGVCVHSPEQHPYEPQPPPGLVPLPPPLPQGEPEPPPGLPVLFLTTLWLAGTDLDNVAACAAVPVSTRAAPIANMPEITRIRSFIPAPSSLEHRT
jgi:hypothetical protein